MGPASGPGCRSGMEDVGWQPSTTAGWLCDCWMGQWWGSVPLGDRTVMAILLWEDVRCW